MLPSTSSHLQQGPTHVTDTGRCPTPCPNPTEVARLGQLFLCCSLSGASPSSRACSVLFPALRLSRAAVCAATELSVRCSQDLFDLRTPSALRPNRRGELVVTVTYSKVLALIHPVITHWTCHFLSSRHLLETDCALRSCCIKEEKQLMACTGDWQQDKAKAREIIKTVLNTQFWDDITL